MFPKIKILSDEVFIRILTYLRSIDLANAREVDKTIFSAERISAAIHLEVLSYSWVGLPTQIKMKETSISCIYRPDTLFIREILCINMSLSSPQPTGGKGIVIFAKTYAVKSN
jgi:hypothetical protein